MLNYILSIIMWYVSELFYNGTCLNLWMKLRIFWFSGLGQWVEEWAGIELGADCSGSYDDCSRVWCWSDLPSHFGR